jgi:hypothetical protein
MARRILIVSALALTLASCKQGKNLPTEPQEPLEVSGYWIVTIITIESSCGAARGVFTATGILTQDGNRLVFVEKGGFETGGFRQEGTLDLRSGRFAILGFFRGVDTSQTIATSGTFTSSDSYRSLTTYTTTVAHPGHGGRCVQKRIEHGKRGVPPVEPVQGAVAEL